MLTVDWSEYSELVRVSRFGFQDGGLGIGGLSLCRHSESRGPFTIQEFLEVCRVRIFYISMANDVYECVHLLWGNLLFTPYFGAIHCSHHTLHPDCSMHSEFVRIAVVPDDWNLYLFSGRISAFP